jgi:hypothetical protein
MIRAPRENPEELLKVIESFLAGCRNPAVLEYGEEPIPLAGNQCSFEIKAGRLAVEVWNEHRCISRRICGIERRATGLLDCTVERFGGKAGKLTLLDLQRPHAVRRSSTASKQHFAEQFRRILCRQFPGWQLSVLSAGLDLQRSFSSVFPRAQLRRGSQAIAAMACPSLQDEPALLTYALIWHSHVRAQSGRATSSQLCLFLPDGAGTLTAHRLRWLTGNGLHYRLFRFNEHGSAGEVDPADLGNLETRVAATYTAPHVPAHLAEIMRVVGSVDGVGICPELSGSLSISCRGLEFARIESGRLWLGLGKKHELSACQTEEVVQFATRLSALSAAGSDRTSAPPVFQERWLESAVRSHVVTIDPELMPDPVHGQVLSFAAQDRDLIDLLGISYSGQPTLLELKVSEDIHLPIQALDYWMRIRWHAERGELQHLFPSVAVHHGSPKLLLIAPALSFHPATDALLRYFAPDILVERVGVNTGWQEQLKVVLRLRGADAPMSQQPGHDLNSL